MFVLQDTPIDTIKAKNVPAQEHSGACVCFEGMVRADRNAGRQVASLLYIADAPACMAEGKKIVEEALSQFPVNFAGCIQRTGAVPVGDASIWIGVWAGHRDEAFKANRYIIEEIKRRLLIWKKEIYTDGTSKWIHGALTKDLSL